MKYKIRCSSTVHNFRDKILKYWKLEEATYPRDKYNPVVFFGMYHIGDWKNFFRYRGKKAIFWCGGDILNFKRNWFFGDGRARNISKILNWIPWNKILLCLSGSKVDHYVENEAEYRQLKELRVNAKIYPSFLDSVDNFPVSFKPSSTPHVFLCMHKHREVEYGIKTVELMSRKFPYIVFHIYGIDNYDGLNGRKNIVFHGQVSEKQFNEEIKNYQAGLRCNEYDGFSEVVIKSVLLGQYPISRIEYPHVWSYTTNTELESYLYRLAYIKQPNLEAREFWLNNINKQPFL